MCAKETTADRLAGRPLGRAVFGRRAAAGGQHGLAGREVFANAAILFGASSRDRGAIDERRKALHAWFNGASPEAAATLRGGFERELYAAVALDAFGVRVAGSAVVDGAEAAIPATSVGATSGSRAVRVAQTRYALAGVGVAQGRRTHAFGVVLARALDTSSAVCVADGPVDSWTPPCFP